jgi:hypothetical protein
LAQITLLTAATATTSAPSAATDGVALPHTTDYATLLMHSTAGSGTMTVTGKLWGYNTQTGKWYPLGTGTDGTLKGIVNDGAAVTEVSADAIVHAEPVAGLRSFQRVALQVTAIGGTSTAITAVLDCIRCDGATT